MAREPRQIGQKVVRESQKVENRCSRAPAVVSVICPNVASLRRKKISQTSETEKNYFL